MDRQRVSELMQEMIIAIDPTNINLDALFKAMMPYLEELAGLLHVAKIVTDVRTEPGIYIPNGMETERVLDFHHEAAPDDEAMKVEAGMLRNTRSTTAVYPWKDTQWDEEERRAITAICKLIYTHASRISMILFQQKIATTDQMTGLNNGPGAVMACERFATQRSLSEYAGCFLNLKNLKYINRQMDNSAGDIAMRRYAATLNGLLDPDREQLARLGGDNFFALVLKSHLDEFLQQAASMRMEIDYKGHIHAITLGAWIGVYPGNGGEHPRDMLDLASFAYELAKRTKVSIAYYSPAMMEASLHDRKISQTLPQALERGELVPFYQPKVSLHTGELYGCEALVRWQHNGRIISPAEFLSVAENSDMITALDMYMLEAVCRDLRSWIDSGLEPVCVSINYSQRDFYRETLIEDTLEILKKYDIDGKYLEIEITETSYFENFDALEHFVDAMHNCGVRVSLDDFGTGYSSLTLFESLNLDTVKLDRSFFVNMDRKEGPGRQVLRSIADMLNQLHKVTVSEGVETPAQLAMVKEIGCDIVQGFYFDKPLPHDAFTERLREKHYKVEE